MVPTDVKVALIDLLTDAGFAAIEADVVRLAQVGAADGRRGRGDGAHPAQARRALPGADAEHEGLRGGARRRRRRGRGVRRGVGNVLAEEHQLLDRREPRARAPDLRRGGGARRARARLHLLRARLPVRGRRRSAHASPTSPHALHAMGAYEVSLGDTIGTGTAGKTQALLAAVRASACRSRRWPGISTTRTGRR